MDLIAGKLCVRNSDIGPEIKHLSLIISFEWILCGIYLRIKEGNDIALHPKLGRISNLEVVSSCILWKSPPPTSPPACDRFLGASLIKLSHILQKSHKSGTRSRFLRGLQWHVQWEAVGAKHEPENFLH